MTVIYIPIILEAAITQPQFNNIIKQFKIEYTAELRHAGLEFIFKAHWNEDKLLASINIPNKKAVLTISGGYARQELMTPDAFRIVICHELGHILGGAPKKGPGHWASIEGQADYYSTAKCMRRVIPIHDNQYDRIAKATLLSGKMLATGLDQDISLLSLETVSTRRMAQTQTLHPTPQCRIDTMLAGLRCPVSELENFSDQDLTAGACLNQSTDEQLRAGARPLCWYRPPTPRYRCITVATLPEHISNMPVITIFQEDFRDDKSFRLQIRVSVTPPKGLYQKRVAQGQHNTQKVSLISLPNNIQQLIIDEQLFDSLKEKSVLPVDWSKLFVQKDGQGNIKFTVNCTAI